MDAIYYISGSLMTLTLFALIIATIFFLLKPHHLQKSKHINKPVARSVIFIVALSSIFLTMLGYGTVMAATEPASVKQERAQREATESKLKQDAQQQQVQQATKARADQERQRQEEAKKPVVKSEVRLEPVLFESIEQQTSLLPKGQTKIATEGINGERTITYEVTYIEGKETARKEIKNEITKAAITKVTQIGTYVAYVAPPVTPRPSAPAPAPSNCDPNYAGQCVPIASDVDCGGGSGNGPAYVYGVVRVVGSDIYDLDRDGDGLGCE